MSLKKTLITTLASFLFVSSIDVSAQHLEDFIDNYNNTDMYRLKQDQENVWKDLPLQQQKGWKQYKRWEYFWKKRLFPTGNYKNAAKIYADVLKESKNRKFDILQSNQWEQLGPFNTPEKYNRHTSSKGLGRINVVRFHPTDPNEFWVGAASGGVWRTRDKGKTWESFPFTQFLSLGVSDIAISPTNPNIVYVATGDANGSLGTAGYYSSIGIIKTTDGGKTWNVTNIANELEDKNIISRLYISPEDPDVVIAGTIHGLFKTTDGGKTWENKQSGSFRDIEVKPDDHNVLYAATAGRSVENYIYKSINCGDDWIQIRSIPEAGRIQLSTTPANSNYVYALCSQFYHSGFHSFQISDDCGENWEVQADSSDGNYLNWGYNLSETNRGQSYYDLSLASKLTDETSVILGGIECHRSTDAGNTWVRSTNTYNENSAAHADQHDLVYNPLNNELYLCNDGGIYVSKDDGITWEDLTNGLSITQYYRFSSSTSNPSHIICGAQDNGTSMLYNDEWYQLYGGDGMDCAIDPNNDNILYASLYYGTIFRSTDNGKNFTKIIDKEKTGEEGDWIAPFEIDPQNSNVLYAGFYNVWKSTNSGTSWNKISSLPGKSPLEIIKIAPTNSNYIYAVTGNSLYKTSDGGKNWKLIASPSNSVTGVAISPNNPDLIWYTVSGYNSIAKVFMYDGETSTNLTGNLPNVPINAIVYQKDSPDRVYIGTDIGMFYSDNKSNIWDNINGNLPNVIVDDLEIYYGSSTPKLRAATYGRGLWQTDVITCNEPALELSQNGTIQKCSYDEIEISASGDYSNYVWSDGTTGKNLRTKNAGTYSVSATDGDCKVRSMPVTIENILAPNISISIVNNKPACIGDTIVLSATLGFKDYKWSNGGSERRINVWESGDYSVSGNRDCECDSYSDTLHVEFYPIPDKPLFEVQGNQLIADSNLTYFQWYLNGVAIKNATKRIYEVTESGTYSLNGMNAGKCGSMSDDVFVEFSSVNDDFNHIYSIFPNPSNGSFTFNIDCEAGDRIEYSISNTLGQTLMNGLSVSESNNFRTIFDLSNQPNGVYMLTIKVNNKSKVAKLIKR